MVTMVTIEVVFSMVTTNCNFCVVVGCFSVKPHLVSVVTSKY